MRNLVIIVTLVLLVLTVPFLAQTSGKFGYDRMSPQDQTRIEGVQRDVVSLEKDISLAQTQLQLAQARVVRLNEVVLPKLVADLRKTYNLPEAEWTWDLNTFTFNHNVVTTSKEINENH